MSARLDLPRRASFDRDYWLCRCQRFRVDAASGHVGVVEDVRFSSRLDRPDYVGVRVGFRRNVVLVPIDEVEEIDPAARRLRVRTGPGRGAVRRWLRTAHIRR